MIINNGSGASMMGAQGLAHYTAAKHGVMGLMKSLPKSSLHAVFASIRCVPA